MASPSFALSNGLIRCGSAHMGSRCVESKTFTFRTRDLRCEDKFLRCLCVPALDSLSALADSVAPGERRTTATFHSASALSNEYCAGQCVLRTPRLTGLFRLSCRNSFTAWRTSADRGARDFFDMAVSAWTCSLVSQTTLLFMTPWCPVAATGAIEPRYLIW